MLYKVALLSFLVCLVGAAFGAPVDVSLMALRMDILTDFQAALASELQVLQTQAAEQVASAIAAGETGVTISESSETTITEAAAQTSCGAFQMWHDGIGWEDVRVHSTSRDVGLNKENKTISYGNVDELLADPADPNSSLKRQCLWDPRYLNYSYLSSSPSYQQEEPVCVGFAYDVGGSAVTI
ncbi:hypothetical protein K438DRAFT_1751162 [Mycena galopus ATCC 62051]|nr:hypothetical protein K438DRAFT_1751162 [Mycena galopus ATCC 62051]